MNRSASGLLVSFLLLHSGQTLIPLFFFFIAPGSKSPGLMILHHETSDDTVQAFINSHEVLRGNGWELTSLASLYGQVYQNANSSTSDDVVFGDITNAQPPSNGDDGDEGDSDSNDDDTGDDTGDEPSLDDEEDDSIPPPPDDPNTNISGSLSRFQTSKPISASIAIVLLALAPSVLI